MNNFYFGLFVFFFFEILYHFLKKSQKFKRQKNYEFTVIILRNIYFSAQVKFDIYGIL